MACEDGHQTCECSNYLRIGLDLANTLGRVSYYNFIFCSVLKEGESKRALEQTDKLLPTFQPRESMLIGFHANKH